MGQITIPQSLRLAHLKNWQSDWTLNTGDYSKIFFLEYTLHQYLKSICKRHDFYLHKVKLRKIDQNLNIYLHFYNYKKYKNKTLKTFEKYLNIHLNRYLSQLDLDQSVSAQVFLIHATLQNLYLKKLLKKKFKKFTIRRLNQFKDFIKIAYMSFYLKSPKIFNIYMVQNLKKNKRHKQFLKNINKYLIKQLIKFKQCLGYKVEFKGRINGRSRGKTHVIRNGQTPSNTLCCNIKYDFQEVLTPSGICSLKTWFYYKK